MNKELKNKRVTWAAITLMYSWTFKKAFPSDLGFEDALGAVRRKLTSSQLIKLADSANEIVDQGVEASTHAKNRAAN